MKIAINSNTSGTVRYEKLNGRNHVVTNMRPIVGDIVMNRGLYPDDEVTNSYMQLEQLPAPNGHPKVNGRNISAFHPLAVNSHNVGAFVRNPTKKGKEVYSELWVDEQIANQSDDGKEVLRRIGNGESIGVSTGLELTKEVVNEDGIEYSWVGRNYRFDHVAILLNEVPAGGAQTVTVNEDELEMVDLQTNEVSLSFVRDIVSSLLNEGRSNNETYAYISDVITDSESGGYVIYELGASYFKRGFTANDLGNVTLSNDIVKVAKTVSYIELNDASTTTNQSNEESEMIDKTKSDGEGVTNGEITIEGAIDFLATKGLKVVNASQFKDEDVAFFVENKDQIASMLAEKQTEINELKAKVLEVNSDLTQDEVDGMSVALLRKLSTSTVANRSLQRGSGLSLVSNANDVVPDYTPNYSGGAE